MIPIRAQRYLSLTQYQFNINVATRCIGIWAHLMRGIDQVFRLTTGNFGDCKPLRESVWELRIDWGAGYRVYYVKVGEAIVLLLCGGDKRKQDADIYRAIQHLTDFKRRTK